ncbi:MAG: hypothetical protein ABIN91_15165 [Mucilaginibacter sp.]|uniref:hypothetical protein n=1 Tax=Mucilaginibacter sp. TaxID=1882438 RepID=UPI0032670F2F
MKSPKKHTSKTALRASRLSKGKIWLGTYIGKNKVRGYAERFRVDLICAIKELRMLGEPVSDQYELAVKQTLENRWEQKKLKQENEFKANENSYDNDDNFAFIIGYTSGGAAYGVRWEDLPDDEDGLI